jgi:homoserine dehydrogenase
MAKPALVYNSSQRPSFYNLEGKDNIVLFFTDRYVDQPLLIKAGAGAEVTASGILLMLFELETYKLVVISKGKLTLNFNDFRL